MKRMIWVTFQKEGVHSYPDAPASVAYLRNPHRHVFHFKVWIEVFHDDREIEFIIFKRELEDLFGEGALKLHNQSCEMLSDALHKEIATKYPHRRIQIEVSEDGENGAITCYDLNELGRIAGCAR